MSEAQRLQQLEDLAGAVRSGSLPRPAFAAAISGLVREMAQHEQQLRDVEIPEEVAEALRSELSAALDGLTRLRQGVERMGRYADEPTEVHLVEGLDLVRRAQAEIVQAVQMNRRMREALERRLREAEPT